MGKKLSVAFLWHMHQPLYKDLVTGRYHLPWVRLHSTYSYLDMASVLRDFPGIRCTFNFTPSLLWQLKDLSGDNEPQDIYLELSHRRASDLDEEDRVFILRNFFSCNLENAASRFSRYGELFSKRGQDIRPRAMEERAREFSVPEMRDLQVLFNLAWCGYTLMEKDETVKGLAAKGKNFSEKDKELLMAKQRDTVASIIPMYKGLQDDGKIEVSTSPFYHPILPLLCGGGGKEGYALEGDAREQVDRAVKYYKDIFGRAPAGMWPSEGSVSQSMIPLLAEAGIKWMATDEGILFRSVKDPSVPREELLYDVFTVSEGAASVNVVFRDINISNAISFWYATMPPERAVSELMKDLGRIRKSLDAQSDDHIVSVILDGENPWPYYPGGGQGFLSGIYRELSDNKGIKTTTMGDYISSHGRGKEIKKLFAGSWIDSNFRKWIGSPQKNKAWEYLVKARQDVFEEGTPDGRVLEELYIAEGSDWFWWYDDFGTELNYVFDDIFRSHLANMYRLSGRDVPYYIDKPIPTGPAVARVQDISSPAEMSVMPRILLVSPEAVPFAKTGGLADVSGSLPKALVSMGCDVRVIMPLYRCVEKGGWDLTLEARNVKHPILGRQTFDLYSARENGVTTYFVGKKEFFDREGLYGRTSGDHRDNALRFSFLCGAVLGALKPLRFRPDIIHCNDWQSALLPFYLRFGLPERDGYLSGIKTLFTIHNLAYQGVFNKRVMPKIGLPWEYFNMDALEFYGKVNFMKSGILYSDIVNTVSHRYAEEIMTEEYGCGLEGLLRTRRDVLYGIPNGVDYSVWSPERDEHIKVNFGPNSIGKKTECKKDLIAYTGLDIPVNAPVLGCVTRLAEQKGMDLFAEIIGKVAGLGAGIVILGRGDAGYNRMFKKIAARYEGKVFVCNDFNDELAHKIEAGSDMFIMPSRFEPCGLNQMYSIKYGTVPVVRATGGLDDVIVDPDENVSGANGFKFWSPEPGALLEAVKRAINMYMKEPDKWKELMLSGMGRDFSWRRSAEQYLALYRKMMM